MQYGYVWIREYGSMDYVQCNMEYGMWDIYIYIYGAWTTEYRILNLEGGVLDMECGEWNMEHGIWIREYGIICIIE